jgi:prophage regulatory protein
MQARPDKFNAVDACPHNAWEGCILGNQLHKFLRLKEVQSRVPFSRSQIYLLIKRGDFPAPHSLGARAVAWLESEIDAWIAARLSPENGR